MPGLNLGLGGGIRLGGTSFTSPPATIAQTAYGTDAAPSSAGGGIQDWHFGVGVGVAGLAWLVFLRYSLPG